MSPIRLPIFEGDKRETCALQYVLHFARDDLHGDGLHLRAVLDVAERCIIVRMPCARHDVIRSGLRLAEHGEIRVTHTVEIEVMNAELADPLALVAQCGWLDVFPIWLRADNIDARSRSRITLFKGDNLSNVAPLIILRRDDVVVKIIFPIIEFILCLLSLPTLQEGENDLRIEGKRPTAAVSLEIAYIMQTNLSAHGKPLYLLRDGKRHTLHIAIIP